MAIKIGEVEALFRYPVKSTGLDFGASSEYSRKRLYPLAERSIKPNGILILEA